MPRYIFDPSEDAEPRRVYEPFPAGETPPPGHYVPRSDRQFGARWTAAFTLTLALLTALAVAAMAIIPQGW